MMQRQTSLQDTFLTRVRRAKSQVTVFLMNGYQLRGVITGFDSFAVVLVSEGKQQFIYKHAVSTIVPFQPVPLEGEEEG